MVKPVPAAEARSSNGCALVQLLSATAVGVQSVFLAEIYKPILLSVFPNNCVASDTAVRPEEESYKSVKVSQARYLLSGPPLTTGIS
jgi:hypothetical protein